MNNPRVLKGPFGRYYRIVSRHDDPIPPHLTAMPFTALDSASRFLRSLETGERFWHQLAFSLDLSVQYGGNTETPLAAVSHLLVQGRLRVYEIADFAAIKQNAQAGTLRNKDGSTLRFMPSAALLLSKPKEQKHFTNTDEAIRFIEQCLPDQKALESLAASVHHPIAPTPAKATAHRVHPAQKLAQALVDGHVVVAIDRPQLRSSPSPKAAEQVVVGPAGLQPAGLGPVTQNERTWVEVKLIDDDGEPVAGAKCQVRDSEGTEFNVMTGANGVARLTGIAPGPCSVSFTELDGWESV